MHSTSHPSQWEVCDKHFWRSLWLLCSINGPTKLRLEIMYVWRTFSPSQDGETRLKLLAFLSGKHFFFSNGIALLWFTLVLASRITGHCWMQISTKENYIKLEQLIFQHLKWYLIKFPVNSAWNTPIVGCHQVEQGHFGKTHSQWCKLEGYYIYPRTREQKFYSEQM